MKQLVKIALIMVLGIITSACMAQSHVSKYQRGDTVFNKRTKEIYVIDSLQYRESTATRWTTNFYTAHFPGDTRYFSYDIVESALIKPSPKQWLKIRKRIDK